MAQAALVVPFLLAVRQSLVLQMVREDLKGLKVQRGHPPLSGRVHLKFHVGPMVLKVLWVQ